MNRVRLAAWALVAASPAFAAEPQVEPLADLTGRLVDARTGAAPQAEAVIQATWSLRRTLASGKTERKVLVKDLYSFVGGRFEIRDWRQYVREGGWKLAALPVVRVYAPGYRRATSRMSDGRTIELHPLPKGTKALAAELSAWKRDIDRDAAISEHAKLLVVFDRVCRSVAAQPRELCYDADSSLGRLATRARIESATYLVVEEREQSEKRYRIGPVAPGSRSQGAVPGDSNGALGYSSIPRPY